MFDIVVSAFGIFGVAFLGGVASGAAKHIFLFAGRKTDEKLKSWNAIEALLTDQLDEVRALSIEYWSQDEDPSCKTVAARLVALFESIRDLYQMLFQDNKDQIQQLDDRLSELLDVVTGGTFQQANRTTDAAVIASMEYHLIKLRTQVKLFHAQREIPLV